MTKTLWWRLPYAQPLLLAALVWGGGATWWYVCTTQQLCEAQSAETVSSMRSPSVSVGTASDSLDEAVAQPPATLEAYYMPDSSEQIQAPDYSQTVEYLKAHPNAKIIVTGYFADVPSDVVGSDLSKARAEVAKAQLVELGVDAGRISTQSKGADPSLNPSDDASLAHARRAEITTVTE